MQYRVLARKYRPQNFADLVGQDVLVRTLGNAFASGRIAHAFLLTGIRGIGKTTTARIIAKALNCIGVDGKGNGTIDPCGVCSNCTMITEGRHIDVIEMDAASNTGVDDIRGLIATVQYAPTSARNKVYIIDEVHMLSNSAFNALLKTLEEPPDNVKFIFATTEIRKIPVTILSRCQRFDLKRLDTELLASHLKNILAKENVQAEEEALALIADAGEGSVRDALSLLDQAISHIGEEGLILAANVRNMLGMNDKSQLFALLEGLFSGDIANVLQEFRKIYAAGGDPLMLLQDLLALIHFISRIKITPSAANDVAFSQNERQFGEEKAEKLSIVLLTKFWQMLLKGLQEARIAPDPVAAVEMILIRIAHMSDLPDPTDLIRKLKNNEFASQSPSNPSSPGSPVGRSPVSLITTNQTVIASHTIAEPIAGRQAIADFESAVALFKQNREIILHNHLMREARLVSFSQGKIELNISSQVSGDFVGRIGKLLTEWTGERWLIVLSQENAGKSLYEIELELAAKELDNAKSNPIVASILEKFPDAKLTKITTRSK